MIWFKEKIKQFYLVIIFMVLWQLGSYLNLWNKYIIPYPKDVLEVMFELIRNGELIQNVSVSIIRVLIGFSISFMLAFPLGVFLGIKKGAHKHLKLILEFLRHVPPLSLIPMLILWFGIGEISKIIIIVLASFFPIFLNVLKGITSCDKKLLEVGDCFGFNSREKFLKIILPNAILDIFVGMKIGFGYSWRAIIGAELIAASSGLGYMILDAQQLSRSDKVIVGILTIGIMGCLTDYLFIKIINKYSKSKGW